MNLQTLEENYAAVVNGAGLVSLEGWNTVRVAGADRATFLHNMCTNDVKDLTPGGSRETFFTDVKGKIISHAFVLALGDAIELLMSPGQAERLIAHLDRYIIREDVRLTDVSAEVTWQILLGSRAPEFAGEESAAVAAFKCDAAWCDVYVLRCGANDARALRAALVQRGAVECQPNAWQAIRVESAWPLFGVDFDGSNLPQEVNRDARAIHFRKGCYLGQETIARIDALGHVNKKLVQVRFDGNETPAVGSEVLQGEQAVGQVTSVCWSPKWKAPLALAMVRRGANEVGAHLRLGSQQGEVAAPT